MKIREVLARDPRHSALANSGQARIVSTNEERERTELRAELETFVCEGQYADAIQRILDRYLQYLDRPRQDAAWVSGFYGSGKSHLLKMLGHLWVDTPFPDGTSARTLVSGLPTEITAHLRELDVRVARSGRPAFAAAGAMPTGSHDRVRETVLAILLRACGLPEHYPQALFHFWLRENGFLDSVRLAVESAGKDWVPELNNLYTSPLIARALLEVDPNFASDERNARQVLRDRFPLLQGDLTTAQFLSATREALACNGELPLSILVLDEVQQFIGDSTDRSVIVSELAEAVQTQLDSRVMLVASGQSALSATSLLQRLQDRFRIQVQLSDTDVETVTRKVLLHKKPSAVNDVRAVLERNAGEVSKHLAGTRLAERTEDRRTIVQDYPLLPTRRRFWEECIRALDKPGTRSQLRSQLRILFDALQECADRELGALVPADVLFRANFGDFVSSGALLNELATRIQSLRDGTPQGELRHRIAGLVFLINKLPREAAVDTGLRATARIVADLMVEDLEADSGPLRRDVERELEELASEGALMSVGDEYRLQTTEGAEWERALRERLGALTGQEGELAHRRDQLLAGAVQKLVGEIRFQQGDAKLRRRMELHTRSDAPSTDSDALAVWLRDGFNVSQKEVEGEARRQGIESPLIHVFLPRRSADELKARILEAAAAKAVLDAQGSPSQPAGMEARESMLSRLAKAEKERDEIVRELMEAAHVYLGGGSEVFGESLREKLDAAAGAAAARMYPRFGEADARTHAWEAALKRAKEGSDQPLVPVGWSGATEDHAVVREVLMRIGAGARGSELRKLLEGPPYGWPRDAIDTALIALHRAGTLRATLNGQLLAAGQLDQSKLQSAEFRPEKVRLGTTDKIALRGLFQKAGLTVRSGEEELRAPSFLEALLALARSAGGEPPLPARPSIARIEDLKRLSGSEQLGAILSAKEELERHIDVWTALARRAEERLPVWTRLQRLRHQARDLAVAAQLGPEIDAIESGRSLLDDADRVSSMAAGLGIALRAALTERTERLATAHERGLAILAADAGWSAADPNARSEILRRVGLALPAPPAMRTDEELLAELERAPLESRDSASDAVPERVARALAELARRSAPAARRVSLRAATLSTEAEVRDWLAEQSERLLDAVRNGPVIVG